jgi:excisionase family DNA binding protein
MTLVPVRPKIPDPRVRPVLSVVEAGAFLGLGRNGSYDAVHTGQIPVIRVGRRLLVPTAALLRLVGLDATEDPA